MFSFTLLILFWNESLIVYLNINTFLTKLSANQLKCGIKWMMELYLSLITQQFEIILKFFYSMSDEHNTSCDSALCTFLRFRTTNFERFFPRWTHTFFCEPHNISKLLQSLVFSGIYYINVDPWFIRCHIPHLYLRAIQYTSMISLPNVKWNCKI